MGIFFAFLSAFLFGSGLIISQMTKPSKVMAFLDITGDWDPSLMFVMVGAIGVHSLALRLFCRVKSPVLAKEFRLPQRKELDLRLISGSALFGIGWGVAGLCPGPGIVASVSGQPGALVFVSSMVLAMYLFRRLGFSK